MHPICSLSIFLAPPAGKCSVRGTNVRRDSDRVKPAHRSPEEAREHTKADPPKRRITSSTQSSPPSHWHCVRACMCSRPQNMRARAAMQAPRQRRQQGRSHSRRACPHTRGEAKPRWLARRARLPGKEPRARACRRGCRRGGRPCACTSAYVHVCGGSTAPWARPVS